MNTRLWEQGWHIVSWTMIYFLAAGTVVVLLGSALRFALRRAHPTIRYTTSLAGFAATTAMAQHPLAYRIRRILNLVDEPMLISRKTLIAVAKANSQGNIRTA